MKYKKISIQSILAALLGVFFMAMGLALNSHAGLGNDPVGIIYDGIRSVANLSAEQLGIASNGANIGLVVLLFFVGRRYLNIGTLIYFLPYGMFVNIGKSFCLRVFPVVETLAIKIEISILGCLLLYLGIAIFIVVDIGTDPFTGLVLVIRDKVKKEYRIVKIGYDAMLIVLGTLMGGKLGAVTIVTALLGGPIIQAYIDLIHRFLLDGRRKNAEI